MMIRVYQVITSMEFQYILTIGSLLRPNRLTKFFWPSSLTREARLRIVSRVQHLGLCLLQIPSIEELTSGQASISSLRPISVEDLLGRDTALPQSHLLGPGVTNNSACVTGAGGSIGSELCRQILKLSPSKLVVIERSEPSLYSLQLSLQARSPESVEIVYILADCSDYNYMKYFLKFILFRLFFMLPLTSMFLLLKSIHSLVLVIMFFQRIQFVGHVFLPLLISSFSFHPTKLSDQPM